jgi:hypothetical protein
MLAAWIKNVAINARRLSIRKQLIELQLVESMSMLHGDHDAVPLTQNQLVTRFTETAAVRKLNVET